MLANARSGKFDVIVAEALDRLGMIEAVEPVEPAVEPQLRRRRFGRDATRVGSEIVVVFHRDRPLSDTSSLEELKHASEASPWENLRMWNSDGLPRRDWFKHQIYAPGFYTGYGVKTMSIGYLIDPDQPMIWRGPMVTGALQQLLNQSYLK